MPQLSPHNIQEEQNIFFVYDKSELRNNESNPEDGLLFFFPSTVSILMYVFAVIDSCQGFVIGPMAFPRHYLLKKTVSFLQCKIY